MALRSIVVTLFLALAACGPRTATTAQPQPEGVAQTLQIEEGGLGSRSNPVLTTGPFGQREYLTRLRCPDGTSPEYNREGSVGRGADGHVLDVYRVECGSTLEAFIYMDMYHEHREREAINSFTVLPELPARMASGCPPRVFADDADASARYIFNFLEVETESQLLNPPPDSISIGTRAFVNVSLVVDREGRVERSTIQQPRTPDPEVRTATDSVVGSLRFTPALHHEGCPVRQGLGLRLVFH